MIGAKMLFLGILVFGAFSSLLITVVVDAIYLASTPSVQNFKQLMVDTGNLILQSQAVVKDSVVKLGAEGTLDDGNYSAFLFQRIISGSILTLFFVYFTFWILKKMPALNLTAPLYLMIFAVLIIAIVQILTGLIISGELQYPFSGFLEILKNPDAIVNYIEKSADLGRFYINDTGMRSEG